MCGIAGIYGGEHSEHPSKAIHIPELLQKMQSSLVHRGNDDSGLWIDEKHPLGFAHQRLSIIDLSKNAAQPMHYARANKQLTIVHNGEIYNYQEIRKELQAQGYHFQSQSDTEVLVAAYDCWQENCLKKIDGMFAFAIWDGYRLFIARDRFGEKPLYFHHHKHNFYFASEIKALWAAGIAKEPNYKMLFNYITIGYVDHPEKPDETFYENIFKLPAAHYLFYTPVENKLETHRYWDINPSYQQNKISESEALDTLTHLFSTSINRRLRSDVSIGSSLSGGIDSSCIVAYSAMHLQGQSEYKSVTAAFPGFAKSEEKYARQVAEAFGIKASVFSIDESNISAHWDAFCTQQDEPVGSASAFAQYLVYRKAKEENIPVLLDGQGADEIFAGYHRYYKWYWQELFRQRKFLGNREYARAKELGVEEKFGLKNILAALFPDVASVFLENQYLSKALHHPHLHPDFVKQQSKDAYYATPERSTLNGALYFNTCTHGLEELLRYADRNSMAFGREIRLPFLSHELVEFAFSLPPSFKIKDGWTKWILRKMASDKLPENIVWRKDKVGYEPPQKQWMEGPFLKQKTREAKQKLVEAGVLSAAILTEKPQPTDSYAVDNFDWRYLSAAILFL